MQIALTGILMVSSITSIADTSQYIEFNDENLVFGRTIWLGTCENCHGYGVADAPVPMKPKQWVSRVTKDRSTLYDHAINGFFGPDDSYMPERGGNPALSDREVKAAVDYMVNLAQFYIDQQEK